MRALGTRDRTQCLGDGDRPGSGAKGWGPGAQPRPPLRAARRATGPSRVHFQLVNLACPAPPPPLPVPTRPPPPPPLSPVILPAQPLSLRPSSRVPLPPGVCLGPALRARLCALRLHLSGAPLPRPCAPPASAPPIPAAQAWRSTSPLARPQPPAPARRPPPGPSIHTKFGCGAAEGGGGPARPSSAPRPARPRPWPPDQPLSDPSSGFKSPGSARRSAPFLTPARHVRPSVRPSRCPSEGPLHPGPKVSPPGGDGGGVLPRPGQPPHSRGCGPPALPSLPCLASAARACSPASHLSNPKRTLRGRTPREGSLAKAGHLPRIRLRKGLS